MTRIQRTTALIVALVGCLGLVPTGSFAAADLQITAMSVQGQAKVGTCNTVSMTVRNFGDTFTGNATLDIALITYPSGTPNLNRVTKNLFISPMQPGAQTSFTISDVEFKVAGTATVQGLVDSTQETPESNENNNSRLATANVSGNCYTPPPTTPPPTNQGCDIEATFLQPSGSSVPGGTSYTYQVRFTNKGTASCDAFKVKLMRYNNTYCGGYGSQVGGSRNWQAVPSVGRNQSHIASFPQAKTPKKGKACLSLGYSPNNYSDANNANHRPKKVVTYQ